jgi:hypothetical protein
VRPRIAPVVAAALVLVAGQHPADQATAKVVRDGKSAPANSAVDAGGTRLHPGRPPQIPYSLIGAISSDSHWFAPCVFWPWRWFGAPSSQREGHIGRLPDRPMVGWILPPLP